MDRCKRISALGAFVVTVLAGVFQSSAQAQTEEQEGTAVSEWVTWTCTDSPCPWGSSLAGEAVAWPQAEAMTQRLGYTVTDPIYLPADVANGVTVWLSAGTAVAYAGAPGAESHRMLATITPEQPYQVAGLEDGEVLSVQGSAPFEYGLIAAPEAPSAGAPASELVTWSCTTSPCPWGPTANGQALVWPEDAAAITGRLGYTTSAGIYLPAELANGVVIQLLSGSATVYAGLPGGDYHRSLATITPAAPYEVSGLVAGEVLSVQDASVFTYQIGMLGSGGSDDADPAGGSQDTSDTEDTTGSGGDTVEAGVGAASDSEWVTFTCDGAPCPWGSSLGGEAIAWPAASDPLSVRLGYQVSAGIYLPAEHANGMTLSILSGSATAYAGFPEASSHRTLATIGAGESFQVLGLDAGEVLSVQSSGAFSYEWTSGDASDPGDPEELDPSGVIHSVPGVWECNADDCSSANWYTEVIPWPAWAAYQNNARSGDSAKAVFTPDGEPLYPYMGSWADGCEVTAVSGTALIIEWERGTDVWRETWLEPGESHTINLTWPEDGAMIESFDFSPGFSVTLNNCEPQPLP